MTYQLVDGRDIWRMHATHGLPLELTIPMLADKQQIPTWKELLDAAKQDGSNIEPLIGRLNEIIVDAYPHEDATIIRERMALLGARYL